ncbi:tyrosine-type recombinase/integrase [Ktedonospora formicarum]|uniref:Uncharacterized protein n=1 Tax=Ktedonospora formicarum TaxID=2778364 RepID=A0A8J3HSK5_9CHLR|nr:tyrosine-type recombinase/integrase [Ktedonospora formicarum]GHO43187.1 hypothetical protein KSX_13500 [Ktedonospora formicarum]
MQKDQQQEAGREIVLTDAEKMRHDGQKGKQPSSMSGPSIVIEERPETDEASLPTPIRRSVLTDQSSLAECAIPYRQELLLRGKSNYTVTCFLSDLKMFSDFAGLDTPVGRLTKEHLTDWLMKLKFGSDHTPAPKTMARRVTFLKNFFSWLASSTIIAEDPSASLTLERPMPPLPELLFADEMQRLLEAAAEEPRCQCLVYLVLFAGLKKEEVMRLRTHHIDLSDPQYPLVTVHFPASTGKQHRERRLPMPPEFPTIYQRYQQQYQLTDEVFKCTDRNLNYILARAVKAADIKKRVTLQLLRDTYAVEQLRSGVTPEALREKLGLSDEAWLESREKYRRLAFPK